MTHVRDYHRALERITASPLTLTDTDFAVLEEYGGPREERRGRDALRTAQLALVPQSPPLQTKAAERPLARPRLDPAALGRMVGTAIRNAVEPLERRVAALEARLAQLAADHQSLVDVVIADLELVAPRPAEPILDPPEPSLDPGRARPARRTH